MVLLCQDNDSSLFGCQKNNPIYVSRSEAFRCIEYSALLANRKLFYLQDLTLKLSPQPRSCPVAADTFFFFFESRRFHFFSTEHRLHVIPPAAAFPGFNVSRFLCLSRQWTHPTVAIPAGTAH